MTQAVDLGTCWSCTDTLTDPAIMATGFQCVAEAVVRRWGTPRGSLIDDPNYGYDLTDSVGDDMGPGDLARTTSLAQAEAEKDERVLACDVGITLQSDQTLKVQAKITTAQGSFDLVVAVTGLTVTLLQVSGQT